MRYRFSGLKRDSAGPVRGHIVAESEEHAYCLLGDSNIVVEFLAADPEPTDDSNHPAIASAVDTALNASSHQVAFDTLTRQYGGKRVWVIDRDKIKRRVVQTVDDAIRQGQKNTDGEDNTRERITEALERLFSDNRNLTSPLSANQDNFEEQIGRLAAVVGELEHAMGSMRSGSIWSMGPPGRCGAAPQRRTNPACDKVLLEIFNTNVELRKRLRDDATKTVK